MKKITAVVLSMLMLAAALTLSSCEGDMGNIGLNSDNTDTSETSGIVDDTSDTVAPEDENKELKELNGKTPEQLYAVTKNLLSKMKQYDLTMVVSYNCDGGGYSIATTLSADMRVTDSGAYYRDDFLGKSEHVYTDGILYVSEGTDRTWYDGVSLEDFLEFFCFASFDVDEEWVDSKYLDFSEATFEPDGELYCLELWASSKNAKRYIENEVRDEDDETEISSASLSIKLTFDAQGTIKEYVMNADYTESEDGYSVKNTLSYTITFKSIGSAEKVVAPYDAQNYVKG